MGLKQLKEKITVQKEHAQKRRTPLSNQKGVFQLKEVTPPKMTKVQTEALVKGGEKLLNEPIPDGYSCVSRNQVSELMQFKKEILSAKICSYDYETDGDPDDETKDPQDHIIVGVSFSYSLGQAIYLPVGHDSYGANWDMGWLVENFLRPVLEDDETIIIAHNVKFEHQMNILHGIDIFPKALERKVICTMILVKTLCPMECIVPRGEEGFDVEVGLKSATKALLANPDGMVHNLIHVDDIKSFDETVGKMEMLEPTGEVYQTGKNKGKPKMKKFLKSRTLNQLPVNKTVIDYGCSDSDWALGLFYWGLPALEREELDEVFFDLDVPNALIMGEYELAGWHISREKLEKMQEVAEIALGGDPEKGIAGIEHRLSEALLDVAAPYASIGEDSEVIVPAGVYDMGNWRGDPVHLRIKTDKVFNWGSPHHLCWLFFYVLEIPFAGMGRSKKTGLPSTGKETIDKILESWESYGIESELPLNQFMEILKEKKKYEKILSTYVDGMLPFCRRDTHKIHTNLKLVSTWRFSSKKPNLQNIPRAENDPMGIRNVFVAPYYDPKADYSHLNWCTRPVPIIAEENLSGYTFYICVDYSQIELKVLAWFAQEKVMIYVLTHGGDLHSTVAKEVFDLPCDVRDVKALHKALRYRAKTINFGLVYGMTEFGLAKDPKMGMDKDEAKAFIDRYFEKYPGIQGYAKSQIAFARENGYVETMFGHRRPLPQINHTNKWIRKSAENQAMNTPIQGSAADIIRKAMVDLGKRIPVEAPYLKSVMQIHDELIFEVPVEYAIPGALFVKEVMEAPIPGFTDIMPLTADPAVGRTWGHALDLKQDSQGYYVIVKEERKEDTDVLLEDIKKDLRLYELAGIEVRVERAKKAHP